MINTLKESIENQLGLAVTGAKACQILSESILEKNNERISVATLRRFWGFLPSKSPASKITLDVLSRFVGAADWAQFQESHNIIRAVNCKEDIESIWINAKMRGDEVSRQMASAIFKKAGLAPDDIIERKSVDSFISSFLKSNYSAASLVAPAGFGKSLSVASWVTKHIQKRQYLDYLFFFINGRQIDASFAHGGDLESWLLDQIFKGVEQPIDDNFFSLGIKIVVVIDAVDEIESTLVKAKFFFSKLIDFIVSDFGKKNFKFLLTARTSVWEREFVHDITSNEEALLLWQGIDSRKMDDDYTNVPLLTRSEIQQIIDLRINRKQKGAKLLVEQLSFSLIESLSYPYLLKLFVSIYTPNLLWVQNSYDVIDEFIKREIASARYADEKLDIINYILKLQDYGKVDGPIRKSNLKDAYPVHLRKSGNYFAAYESLLAFGILSEETAQNQFKNLITHVDFTHYVLRDLLITRKIVEDNNGVTPELFKVIDAAYQNNSDLRKRLIMNIFSIAYAENNFAAIKDFFLLPNSIKKDRDILKSIVGEFRNDKPIRSILIKEYARYPEFVDYLLKSNFEFDSISTSFYKVLEEITQEAKSNNEKIFCNAGLALDKLLVFDVEEFNHYSSLLLALRPDCSCMPNTLMLWMIWRILYMHVSENPNIEDIILADLEFVEEQFASCADRRSTIDYSSFLVEMLPFTFVFKNVGLSLKIVDKINTATRKYGIDPNQQKVFEMFALLLETMNGNRFDVITDKDAAFLEYDINNIQSKHRYVNRIVAYVLLAKYYLSRDDQDRFSKYFRTALEVCSNVNYRLLEVSLLKTLAKMLQDLGLKHQSVGFVQYSRGIVGEKHQRLYEIL